MSDDRKNSEGQPDVDDPAARAFSIYQAALATHRSKSGKGVAETVPLPQTRELLTPVDGQR